MKKLRIGRLAALLLAATGLAEYHRGMTAASTDQGETAAPVTHTTAEEEVSRARVAIPFDPPRVVKPIADPLLEVLATISEMEAPVAASDSAQVLPAVGSEGGPARDLSSEEEATWLAGRALFERKWESSDGLGAPGFNAESCETCHNAPVTGGAGGKEFNVVRVLGSHGYEPVQTRGNQLERMRRLTQRAQRKQQKGVPLENRPSLGSMIREIQTPSILGLGRLDTIFADEILSREDPGDDDGDGIHGIARRVDVGGVLEVGRFGWKAQMPRLSDFVCLALGGETGITVPDQGRSFGLVEDKDGVRDPEITQSEFDQMVYFMAHLAPPLRSEPEQRSEESRIGEDLFLRIGCADCHVPALMGSEGPVRLYSDLLLHEVIPPPNPILHASGQQRVAKLRILRLREKKGEQEPTGFRTPPLWGVGKTAPYMHDGRAKNLRDAILAHDMEAAPARERFELMREIDQKAMIEFLETL